MLDGSASASRSVQTQHWREPDSNPRSPGYGKLAFHSGICSTDVSRHAFALPIRSAIDDKQRHMVPEQPNNWPEIRPAVLVESTGVDAQFGSKIRSSRDNSGQQRETAAEGKCIDCWRRAWPYCCR